jgi:hypothetical protein
MKHELIETLEVTLPKGSVSLPSRSVHPFFKALTLWRVAHGKVTPPAELAAMMPAGPNAVPQHRNATERVFKEAFFEAYTVLKHLKIQHHIFLPVRQGNFIGRPQGIRKPEGETLKLAFEKVWFRGITDEELREIIKQSAPTAYAGMDPRKAAKLLGLKTGKNSQIALADLGGHYFIFRRLPNEKRMVVGYMEVTLFEDLSYPARFVTLGQPSSGSRDSHETVAGVLYHPDDRDNPNALFTLGKMRRSSQIRSTIVEPVLKPGIPNPEQSKRDLSGVRLGLGRPEREIIGYPIWASRLMDDVPENGGWQPFAREFDLAAGDETRFADDQEFFDLHGIQPDEFFAQHVIGFRRILGWFKDQHIANFKRMG